MKIDNIFTRFAKSNLGKKIYKNVLHPSREQFLNNHLPIIESAIVTGFYMFSTQVQKDIPKENKKSIQIQNVLSFLVSAGTAIPLNKQATKLGKGIIKHLKPELMKDGHKVVEAIEIGMPMLTTLLISRFLVAVGLVPLSTKIREVINNKKLDING